jgi:hypothetical protein
VFERCFVNPAVERDGKHQHECSHNHAGCFRGLSALGVYLFFGSIGHRYGWLNAGQFTVILLLRNSISTMYALVSSHRAMRRSPMCSVICISN